MSPTNETLQSAVSYSASAGGVIAVHYSDVVAFAQDSTIFIALAVGIVRLIYDGARLVRFLKEKNSR